METATLRTTARGCNDWSEGGARWPLYLAAKGSDVWLYFVVPKVENRNILLRQPQGAVANSLFLVGLSKLVR